MKEVNFGNMDEITIVDVLKFFIRHQSTILFTTIIFFIFGIIYIILKPKTYIAESGLLIIDTKPEVSFEPKIQIKDLSEYLQSFDSKKKTVSELIKSPIVLNDVLNKAFEQGLIEEKSLRQQKALYSKIEIFQTGNVLKIQVKMSKPQQAKFFADEIAKITVEKSKFLVVNNISQDILKQKLEAAKQEYENSFKKYNYFLQNNKILELTTKITQLQKMYNYYKDNLIQIEQNIWKARNLKEQLQSGSITNVGELADSLALLKFKSSIFSEESELPLKLEINQYNNTKLDKDSVVKEIDSIISILEERKKDFEEQLNSQNYEKQIQKLQSELEKEKKREKDLIKDRDLNWESLVALERKIKEIEISDGIVENVLVKIAYLSELPKSPDNGKEKIIVLVSTVFGLFSGILIGGFQEIYKIMKGNV